LESGAIQIGLFDTHEMAEITHPDYPDERLVVCRNPQLARQRAYRREELLEATEKELEKVKLATSRAQRRLKGQAKIGLRVGKVGKFKMTKHFIVTIEEESFTCQRRSCLHRRGGGLNGIYVDPNQCA
jgi:hypothetical protein